MSETKHTPKPWFMTKLGKKSFLLGPNMGPAFFNIRCEFLDNEDRLNIENARLLVQAPELLAERDALRAEVARLKEQEAEVSKLFCCVMDELNRLADTESKRKLHRKKGVR